MAGLEPATHRLDKIIELSISIGSSFVDGVKKPRWNVPFVRETEGIIQTTHQELFQ